MTTTPPDPKLWPEVLGRLVAREDLSADLAEQAMAAILGGVATDAQIAGFAVALRAKGETVTELAALARTMLRYAERVELPEDGGPVVDTCGTGGDGSHTVNISTLAGIVVAAAGVRVAKHGNRAMSSACGSADVLEELGVAIELGPAGVAECIAIAGIGFCLAPRYHPAMRFAGPARDLGVRTTFNFLGPLANPAGAPYRVVGVSDRTMAHSMVGALAELGAERAMVFCGDDGLDELTTTSSSTVWELAAGEVREYTVEPRALGLPLVDLEVLVGGDARCNADIARRVLDGDAGPVRDIVALNAAAALVVTDVAENFAGGLERAFAAIDSGRAAATLDAFVAASHDAQRRESVDG